MPVTPGLQLPFGIQPTNPLPVDSLSGPFTGATIGAAIAAANAAISSALRFQSMEVRLIVGGYSYKYWYWDGTGDANLVEMQTTSSGISGPYVSSFNGLTGAVVGVSSVNGATGAVQVVNSFNGLTGAVQGVSAAIAGTGISVSNATGSVTISNNGVLSFNGSTGSVVGVSSVNGATGAVQVVNSFNGSTGAVIGVSSINGKTGSVSLYLDDLIDINFEDPPELNQVLSWNGVDEWTAEYVVTSLNGDVGAVTAVSSILGTTGEIEVSGTTGSVTVGLPNTVIIGTSIVISGITLSASGGNIFISGGLSVLGNIDNTGSLSVDGLIITKTGFSGFTGDSDLEAVESVMLDGGEY